MWRGYTGELSPGKFLQEFRSNASSLGEFMRQQDAHEALTFLLDRLHDSMNQGKSNTYHQIGPSSSREAWEQHKRHDSSFIWDLFGGQLKSAVTCNSCGKKSTTFDHFTSLSLELPSSGRCTINNVLEHFTKSERVEWNCPSCKHKSSPQRQLTISHLPQVLILHLKRFSQSWITGEHRKIESHIDFPLENLDISQFISERYRSRNPVTGYNLYAVSNQRGSLISGHYTANVKRYKNWFLCNDSNISLIINPSSVPSEDGYILFYYRKDLASQFM